MKAKLTDGSIVTLEKDCACVHHDGPHWLHMDKLDRELNSRGLNIHGEIARLQEKARNMEQRGIEELLLEDGRAA